MKSVIIMTLAFVLLIPTTVFAQITPEPLTSDEEYEQIVKNTIGEVNGRYFGGFYQPPNVEDFENLQNLSPKTLELYDDGKNQSNIILPTHPNEDFCKILESPYLTSSDKKILLEICQAYVDWFENLFDQMYVEQNQAIINSEKMINEMDISDEQKSEYINKIKSDMGSIQNALNIQLEQLQQSKIFLESYSIIEDDIPVASFVDLEKDSSFYVQRYLTESKYKDWFDTNYPNYEFWEAIGIPKFQYDVIVEELTNPISIQDSEPIQIDPEPTEKSESINEFSNYAGQPEDNTVESTLEHKSSISIIGLSNHYSISEPVEIQVKMTGSLFVCGDLYITIYSSGNDVVTQAGFFEQCFENNQLLPIKKHFSYVVDSSGYYEIVAEMVSKDLKNISIKERFGVGDVSEVISSEPKCGVGTIFDEISNSCVLENNAVNEPQQSTPESTKTLTIYDQTKANIDPEPTEKSNSMDEFSRYAGQYNESDIEKFNNLKKLLPDYYNIEKKLSGINENQVMITATISTDNEYYPDGSITILKYFDEDRMWYDFKQIKLSNTSLEDVENISATCVEPSKYDYEPVMTCIKDDLWITVATAYDEPKSIMKEILKKTGNGITLPAIDDISSKGGGFLDGLIKMFTSWFG